MRSSQGNARQLPWFRGLLSELLKASSDRRVFGANISHITRRLPRIHPWPPDAGWYACVARVGTKGSLDVWYDRYLDPGGDPHLGVWLMTSPRTAKAVAHRLSERPIPEYTWGDRRKDGFLASSRARVERSRIGELFVDDWRPRGRVFVGSYVQASPHLHDPAKIAGTVIAAMRRLADATTPSRSRPRAPRTLAERYKQLIARLARPNQRALRAMLMERHGGRCLISGCSEELALDAAHIDPVANEGSDDADNGLLLRADLHRLFDAGLLTITEGRPPRVAVAQQVATTEYLSLTGAAVAGLTRGQRARLRARNAAWTDAGLMPHTD